MDDDDMMNTCPSRHDDRLNSIIVQGVEDLSELKSIREDNILNNFGRRFLRSDEDCAGEGDGGGSSQGRRIRPYTGAGIDVLVALNPCRVLDDIYGTATQLNYLRYNKTDLPAHAYAVSASAYWALHGVGHRNDKSPTDQVIVLQGDCGSGKSFNASVLLEHLIAATAANVKSASTAENVVDSPCEACGQENTDLQGRARSLHEKAACQRLLLESFGNARTTSNSNSSRFTLYTKVFFSNRSVSGGVSQAVGSEAHTCVLETSRLICAGGNKHAGEKAFHVLHQILHADETAKKHLLLTGKTENDFRITAVKHASDEDSNGGTETILNRRNDENPSNIKSAALSRGSSFLTAETAEQTTAAKGWEEVDGDLAGAEASRTTFDALANVGVEEEEKAELLRGLSAVLHLGQINFHQVDGEEIHRDFGTVELVDEGPLDATSRMLGCTGHDLRNALLTRRLSAGGGESRRDNAEGRRSGGNSRMEMLTVPLTMDQAVRARNSLVQEVYLRLFRWLLKKTNACTTQWMIEENEPEETSVRNFIGLFEMSGFENLEFNGFEQLCKNYSVEKVRGHLLLQGELSRAAETSSTDHYADLVLQVEASSRLLSMFEGPLGLIRLANDEYVCPEGSDVGFVNKFLGAWAAETAEIDDNLHTRRACQKTHSQHQQRKKRHSQRRQGRRRHGQVAMRHSSSLSSAHSSEVGDSAGAAAIVSADTLTADTSAELGHVFIIRHFAGDVRYTADGLLAKNGGGIGQTLLDLLDDSCQNTVVGAGSRSGLYRDGRRASTSDGHADHRRQNLSTKKLGESVLSQHRRQLQAILRDVGGTKIRRIVCVKPNDRLSPACLDRPSVIRQLSMAGVMTAVQKQILSLPPGRRVHKEAFFRDFRAMPDVLQRVLRNDCDYCKLGHDTIFFKEGVWESLETRRMALESKSCSAIQRAWRDHYLRVRTHAEWEEYLQEWEKHQSAQQAATNEMDAKAQWQRHWKHIQDLQRWQHRHEAVERHRQASARGAFGSSNANTVREAARQQKAIADKAEACRQRRVAAEAARSRRKREEEEAASLVVPPKVEAWPASDWNEEPQMQAPMSTTPPSSPPRWASSEKTKPSISGRGEEKQQQKLVVPRLAWLADDAMRAFLTTCFPSAARRSPEKVEAVRIGTRTSSMQHSQRCHALGAQFTGEKQEHRNASKSPMSLSSTQVGGNHDVEQAVPEDGMDFMMSAKQQPLSRTANYYISASPAIEIRKDTRFYIGKVRAHDRRGRTYTVYDNGIAQGQSSVDLREGIPRRRELAGVVFYETREAAEGPRDMEAAIPVEGAWPTDGMKDPGGSIADGVREGRRRPGLVRMRDRKPRYDPTTGTYVLDYAASTMLSVKNFQLKLVGGGAMIERSKDHRRTAEGLGASNRSMSPSSHAVVQGWGSRTPSSSGGVEDADLLLSFGKSGTDRFALDFRWPLSPVQAFGLVLAALDTSV